MTSRGPRSGATRTSTRSANGCASTAGRSRNRASASGALVRQVDWRPLYQRFRALFVVNAPHGPGGRGRRSRAAGLLPGVGERRRSDPHALAVSADRALAVRQCVDGEESPAVIFDEPLVVSVGHRVSESPAPGHTERVANAGADTVGGRARSSTRT